MSAELPHHMLSLRRIPVIHAVLVLGACASSAEYTGADVQDPQGRVPLVERDRPGPPSDEPPPPEKPPSTFSLQFGAGYWPGLGDLQPDGSVVPTDVLGAFDDWGFAGDLVFDTPVAEFGAAHLNLGFDLGLMSYENTQTFDFVVVPPEVYEGRFTAEVFYLTPSARMLVPVSPRFRVYYGLGLGYYQVSLQDRGTYYYKRPLDDESGLGGFLAVGFDYFFGDSDVGLRVESKVHYADFHRLNGFANDLDGFMTSIEMGVVFAF